MNYVSLCLGSIMGRRANDAVPIQPAQRFQGALGSTRNRGCSLRGVTYAGIILRRKSTANDAPQPLTMHVEPLGKRRKDVDESEELRDECPFCLDTFDALNPAIYLRCQHCFHLPCLLHWEQRRSTCPVCETAMDLALLS